MTLPISYFGPLASRTVRQQMSCSGPQFVVLCYGSPFTQELIFHNQVGDTVAGPPEEAC